MTNTMQNGRQTWQNVANTMQHAKWPCQNVGNIMHAGSKLLQVQGKWYRERKPKKSKTWGKKKSKTILHRMNYWRRLSNGWVWGCDSDRAGSARVSVSEPGCKQVLREPKRDKVRNSGLVDQLCQFSPLEACHAHEKHQSTAWNCLDNLVFCVQARFRICASSNWGTRNYPHKGMGKPQIQENNIRPNSLGHIPLESSREDGVAHICQEKVTPTSTSSCMSFYHSFTIFLPLNGLFFLGTPCASYPRRARSAGALEVGEACWAHVHSRHGGFTGQSSKVVSRFVCVCHPSM